MSNDPIGRLVRELGKLPGIGQKTATRLAFHVLRAPEQQARDLAQAIIDVKERIRLCSVCMNLTEADPCALCADPRRDPHLICVVAHPPDLMAIERTGAFRGRYHVLHGVLSPLEGVGPDDLRLRELLLRLLPASPPLSLSPDGSPTPSANGSADGPAPAAQPDTEVILATSPNVEGEATALYLSRVLKPLGVRVSRIASGLPIGGELEYADGITITRALEVRRPL